MRIYNLIKKFKEENELYYMKIEATNGIFLEKVLNVLRRVINTNNYWIYEFKKSSSVVIRLRGENDFYFFKENYLEIVDDIIKYSKITLKEFKLWLEDERKKESYY